MNITTTKHRLACTEQEAFRNLEAAARWLVKHARLAPYGTKLRMLQKPLVQLQLARRKP